MLIKRIFKLLFAIILLPLAIFAQETSSSIGGIVKGTKGEPLAGATVTATHKPTGTIYRTTSRSNGRYDLVNMNPGGPYSISVTFIGLNEDKRDDMFLSLGEKQNFDFLLIDKNTTLSEVVISATRAAAAGKGGSETSIGRQQIATIPTVTRNLSDFLRFTPQAKIIGNDAISIGGQNNRFNAFFIDGAINNDVFGLAASGTNGGQAGAGPISIDAIDQFQVVLSPFDASLGGFTGGGINATTRSGTNDLSGSVYHYFRNEKMAGKTPGTMPNSARTRLANLDNKVTGFRFGGPIIKNKLFFFILGEVQRDERPQPFTFSEYRGAGNLDSIAKLVNHLKSNYNYDPGSFLDNPESLSVDRITAKIDWNLNSKNKLSVSYRLNKAERMNTSASSGTSINFFNNGVFFPSKTNTGTIELKSQFKRNTSNRFLLTYTDVEDNRDQIGDAFPRVTITDGAGRFIFGSENFSTGNYLRQKNWTLNNTFKFYLGNHFLSIGTDNLLSEANNLFVRDLYGTYAYASLDAFIKNRPPTRYDRSFSLLEQKTNEKNSPSAAKFNYLNLAFFINDEIKVNDRFTLNLGLRGDKTEFLTQPIADKFFNDTAIAILSNYYDLKGARTGQMSKVPISISPRIGFVYKMPEENATLRGGVGYFTGRMPGVWPGGVYNNTGLSLGGLGVSNPNITFRADPFNQYTSQDFGLSLLNSKGQLDLMSKEFKLPRILRSSLAFDKKIGNGWTFTTEAILTKNVNEINYQNVNIFPATLKSVGPGARDVYAFNGAATKIPLRGGNINPYGEGIFILSNYPSNKGFAYNLTFMLNKALKNGFTFNGSYTFGESVANHEQTSSQNNSQWRFMETVNGRNSVGRSQSDFSLGHRFYAYASKKFSYLKGKTATTISLVYNGQSGNPFSYTYNQSMVGDRARGETNDLIYIPTAAELQSTLFVSNTFQGVTYNQQQQRNLLEAYIGGNKYLRNNRGNFAGRNADRLPFTHIVDLKIQQDFNVKLGAKSYTLQLSYDVYNFTNMLSQAWGRNFFLANDNYSLITFASFVSAADLTPQFRFNPQGGKPWNLSTSTAPGLSARYISQLGVRLSF